MCIRDRYMGWNEEDSLKSDLYPNTRDTTSQDQFSDVAKVKIQPLQPFENAYSSTSLSDNESPDVRKNCSKSSLQSMPQPQVKSEIAINSLTSKTTVLAPPTSDMNVKSCIEHYTIVEEDYGSEESDLEDEVIYRRSLGTIYQDPRTRKLLEYFEKLCSKRISAGQLDKEEVINGIKMASFIPDEELEFVKIIGEGAYGKVWFGKWKNNQVAIKEYCRKKTDGTQVGGPITSDFIKELEILSELEHPNVLTYLGFSVNENRCYMISEYVENGNLFDHLHKLKTKFQEKDIFKIGYDVAKGMEYLHSKRIFHCDLKSCNILMDANFNVKLCDFGLSRIKSGLTKFNKGRVGTPHWMSPNILREEPFDESADVYSYGMVLWEVLVRKLPYEGMSVMQIVGAVGYTDYQVEIPQKGNKVLLKILRACLNKDKTMRPTFPQILVMFSSGWSSSERPNI
eukprot:TRINITY_DN9313_c0_g1_i1.p1 TRINITY_DN9313_c0_g1~~TRINITY_DN9313_c0_g1_i1.p1  ORF type:complete len:474 (-),score=40.80 TRINITY_DN9313_c0_g1_i1:300-1661(-)